MLSLRDTDLGLCKKRGHEFIYWGFLHEQCNIGLIAYFLFTFTL